MDNGMAEHAYAVRIKEAWQFLQSGSFNIYKIQMKKIYITTVHVAITDQEKRTNQLPQRHM